MNLIAAKAWAEKYFDPISRPSEITLQRWLRAGTVPGRKVGKAWFVDEHAWLADGDDLVQRVLDGE